MVEFEVPNYKISVFGLDADRTAIATGRNMRISPKHAREICHEIKGKYLETAQEYLEQVIAGEKSVPFKRYRKKYLTDAICRNGQQDVTLKRQQGKFSEFWKTWNRIPHSKD